MNDHLPLGLKYIPRFITEAEESELMRHIIHLDWQNVALFGQVARRRVVHFGMDYNYDRRTVKATIPAPKFLEEIISRGAHYLEVDKEDIAEILISEYTINAGINWHRDAPVFDKILGVSLNSPCPIYFRNRNDKKEQIQMLLEPGSAYILKDSIRWEWEHRIPPVKNLRYSITFRTLKGKG